jgi:hypothetical protein
MLSVSERNPLKPAREELLCARFGLTTAQARLARSLACG